MKLEISDEEVERIISSEIKAMLREKFSGNDRLELLSKKAVREYLQDHLGGIKQYALDFLLNKLRS